MGTRTFDFTELFGSLFGNGERMGGGVELTMLTCGKCGTPFAIESKFYRHLCNSGDTFFCPNGHPRAFVEGEVDKLKKQLAQEAKRRERLETSLRDQREENERLVRSRSAVKGQVTKLRNKIANGICPCCDQFFPDLHSHMSVAHPEFETTEPEATKEETER